MIKLGKHPSLAADAGLRLAKWTDTKTALDKLRAVEKIVLDGLGTDDPKTVEVKRELALLLIKRREHDQALEYLNDVQYYREMKEKFLCQSQSVSQHSLSLLTRLIKTKIVCTSLLDRSLERGLYGPQSVQLARTLKALGTVYMLKGSRFFPEAAEALQQSLQVFEANATPPAVIQDVKQKLQTISEQSTKKL